MMPGDQIPDDEWLAALKRHDNRADLRDALLAFLIAAICFGSLWANAAEPQVIDVERARIHSADGGVFEVTGGGWLSDAVLIARASEIVATHAELDRLKNAPAKPSTPLLVLTNIVTGLIHAVGAVMVSCAAATGNVTCTK